VTVDGVSVTTTGVGIHIYASGVRQASQSTGATGTAEDVAELVWAVEFHTVYAFAHGVHLGLVPARGSAVVLRRIRSYDSLCLKSGGGGKTVTIARTARPRRMPASRSDGTMPTLAGWRSIASAVVAALVCRPPSGVAW
jgi:hypothetical protein